MSKTVKVSVDDLTDEGLRLFVQQAVGQSVADLSDWHFSGLLIERFKISLSYTPPSPNSARTILGWDDEPWNANLTMALGDRFADGRTPQIAIAKLVAASQGQDEEVIVPLSDLDIFVKDPDLYRD